jgi:hypothetical protein
MNPHHKRLWTYTHTHYTHTHTDIAHSDNEPNENKELRIHTHTPHTHVFVDEQADGIFVADGDGVNASTALLSTTGMCEGACNVMYANVK